MKYGNTVKIDPRAFSMTSVGPTHSNRSAINARAIVTAGGRKMIDEVMSGASYYSQNSFTLHFGLGQCTEAEDIKIHWPSGIVQRVGKTRADQTLKIVEKQ